MMMCRTGTSEGESAASNSLVVDSKQTTSMLIKDETALRNNRLESDESHDFTNEQVNDAVSNGTTIKKESIKQEYNSHQEQPDTLDNGNSTIEQIENSYSFKPHNQDDICELNPEFAVICSFILQFGEKLDLTLDIEQLKASIEDQDRIDESLIDLHVKLLKKIRRYFVRDLWEKALIRYVSEYSYEDAYELESLGYQKTRPSIKLQLLRRLMDSQFEHDQKFKAAVNLCDANELRILPTGRDLHGHSYWHQTDTEGNLRVFQEPAMNYRAWKTVCSNTTELNNLIEELDKDKDRKVKGDPILEPYNPLPEIFPELFIKEETIEEEKRVETKLSKAKKGRNKGRGKKNEPLPVLKEEKDSNFGLKAIETSKKNDDIRIISKSNSPEDHSTSKKSTINGTDESHVKSILESLVDKVVSSFGYIIRPLSRNSEEQIKDEVKEEEEKEVPVIKAPKKRATKREKPKEEVLPRRSSSRIQQIQQKKIAEKEEEIKKMIEINAAKKTNSLTSSLDDDSRGRSINSRTNRKRSQSPEDEEKKNGKKRRKKGQSWRRGKGKKKLSWDKDDSDLSSTSSVTESNEEDDLDFEEDEFKIESNEIDDEFACEDEDTNIEPVIIKRARTARQNLVQAEDGGQNESSIVEEDKPCGRCDKSNDPEWILLCDMCDDGYHTSCCLPPLMIVPDGDWFCPPCEHKMLLTKLRELDTSIKEVIEVKERERKKASRIRQANVKKEPIKQEPITDKRPRDFLSELNEPLALQALDDELNETSENESSYSYERKPRSRNRKKYTKNKKTANKRPAAVKGEEGFSIDYKKTRKTYSRKDVSDEDESEDEILGMSSHYSSEMEEEEEEAEDLPKTRRARASVSYRFQEYDDLIKSAIQGDSYDEEEESDKESSSDNCNYGRGKDMATIEALAYQQENGIFEQPSAAADVDNPDGPQTKARAKPRKKARRLNDLDAASESGNTTSDESFQASSATEAEDDEMTEAEISGDSDTSIDELVASKNFKSKKKKKRQRSYDSDDSEYQPTRTRRAASQRVSYKESTEDEDSETITSVKKTKKKDTLSSDEESQVSWKSDNESIENEDDRSTSCAESPEINSDLVIHEDDMAEVSPPDKPDINQTAQQNNETPLPSVPAPSVALHHPPPQPPVPPPTSATHVAVATKARAENSNHILPQTSTNTNCTMLDESFDEIAAPFYIKKQQQLPPTKSTPITNTGTGLRPEQQGSQKMVGTDKARDPIRELIQYCSESANSASMFNSYNQTLSTKNQSVTGASPVHPPFYDEDDLK